MDMNFVETLSSDFGRLLESGSDADVRIIVSYESAERVFFAHSLVLRTRSAHFGEVLATTPTKEMKIENVSPGVFELILKYDCTRARYP